MNSYLTIRTLSALLSQWLRLCCAVAVLTCLMLPAGARAQGNTNDYQRDTRLSLDDQMTNAVGYYDFATVRELLKRGVSPNLRNYGNHPLLCRGLTVLMTLSKYQPAQAQRIAPDLLRRATRIKNMGGPEAHGQWAMSHWPFAYWLPNQRLLYFHKGYPQHNDQPNFEWRVYDVKTGRDTRPPAFNTLFQRLDGDEQNFYLSPDGKIALWTAGDHVRHLLGATLDGRRTLDFTRGYKDFALTWLPDSRHWIEWEASETSDRFARAHVYTLEGSSGARLLKTLPVAATCPIIPDWFATRPIVSPGSDDVMRVEWTEKRKRNDAWVQVFPLTGALNEPAITHRLRLPAGAEVREGVLSPERSRIAWLLEMPVALPSHQKRRHNLTTISQSTLPKTAVGIWVSGCSGTEMHLLGSAPVVENGAAGYNPANLRWLPDGKQVSFTARQWLWTLKVVCEPTAIEAPSRLTAYPAVARSEWNSIPAVAVYGSNWEQVARCQAASSSPGQNIALSAGLIQAIRNDDVVGVRGLLKQGADANAIDSSGKTALMLAASRPSVLMIQALLAMHADVNRQDAEGRTALMIALGQYAPACVHALINAGTNVRLRDKQGETALTLTNDVDIATLLLAHGADVQATTRTGDTTLSRAADRGNVKMVRLLLAQGVLKGVVAGTRDKGGRTLLMLAIMAQDAEGVKILLQRGADVQAQDKEGQTALMLAASGRQLEMARRLLEQGANVNARDSQGRTPLMLAAKARQPDIARLLLDRGAQVNAQDKAGVTVLMQGLSPRVLTQMLLEHGADVNARDNRDRTALIIACASISDIHLLLEHGAAVNAQDENGRTALLEAAATTNTDAMRLLFERGADPNLGMKNGFLPLTSAVIQESKETFQLLIQHGANVNARNRRGESLLQIASQYSQHFEPGMIVLLKQAGAKE